MKNLFKFIILFFIANISAFSFDFITEDIQAKFNSANPYKDQVATVRQSSSLSDQEVATVTQRTKINNTALAKYLNTNLTSKNLNIGFCASGGGYRAAICTLGSLQGAQDTGLLDCVTYMSGLSGSTWTMGAWLSLNKSLADLKTQFGQNISKNIEVTSDTGLLDIASDQYEQIVKNLLTKYVFNQPLSSVDIWGAAILDNLFYPNPNRQTLKLSDQISVIKDGSVPFPIYTCISPIAKLQYQWYEFTPYEVGNIATNNYIPTWSFARQFANGQSTYNASEQSLSFLLGIFGSAYDVTPQELVEKCDLESKLSDLPTVILEDLKSSNFVCENYCDDRFLPAQVHSFSGQQDIVLMDAGIDFNLPFPPLLRPERNLDVIIALDASSDIIGAPELLGAQQYAQNNGLKFPAINVIGIEKTSLTVFGLDTYPNTPVVIYMPRINGVASMTDSEIAELKTKIPEYATLIDKLRSFDPETCTNTGCCSTYNFAYSQDQFDLLSGMTYINMLINRDNIADILKNIAFNTL